MFPMPQETVEKLIKLTGPVKVTEKMDKAIKASLKGTGRNLQGQIRFLIEKGLEKIEEEKEASPKTVKEMESLIEAIVAKKLEEKSAKERHPKNVSPGRQKKAIP